MRPGISAGVCRNGRRAAPLGGRLLSDTVTYQNAWVVAADAARRRVPGWAAFLIAVALIAVAMFGGVALYRALPLPEPAAGDEVGLAVERLVQIACILGAFYVATPLLWGVAEGRPSPVAVTPAAVAAPLAGALGVAFFLVALGLAAALGGVRHGAPPAPWPHRLEGLAIGAVLIAMQAAGEEAFFRGWLQPVLAARWGPWISLLLVSLLFAAAHAILQPLGGIAFLNDTLAGLAFGLLALRTGGLAAPIAAHWGWNWAEASIAGATPNPGVDPLGSIFDLDLVGPGWLAGGADEMNGSVCATVALLGLITAAAVWRRRKGA